MGKVLFDSSYGGPRWTYGLQYRPLAKAQVPDGWIIQSNRQHPDFQFGTVDYPVLLPEEKVRNFQLQLLTS